MKKVKIVKTFDHCFGCPFHSGGRGLGSPLYCTYFTPARQITDSNGKLITPAIYNTNHPFRFIAAFCELPDNEIVNFTH